jgi:hypothetical protein
VRYLPAATSADVRASLQGIVPRQKFDKALAALETQENIVAWLARFDLELPLAQPVLDLCNSEGVVHAGDMRYVSAEAIGDAINSLRAVPRQKFDAALAALAAQISAEGSAPPPWASGGSVLAAASLRPSDGSSNVHEDTLPHRVTRNHDHQQQQQQPQPQPQPQQQCKISATPKLSEQLLERLPLPPEDRAYLAGLITPNDEQIHRVQEGELAAVLQELAEGVVDPGRRLPEIFGRALIATTLAGKLHLPLVLAEKVADELVEVVGSGALAAVVSEPARAPKMLQEWAASPACEQKLQEIASAMKPMLRSLAEARITSETLRAAAVRAAFTAFTAL